MKRKPKLSGEKIINFIIKNKLVNVAGHKAVVFVWAANAPSQLDSLLKASE